MGQGYRAIILADKRNSADAELIRTWVDPHEFNNGYKLTEHSYIGNNFVEAVEYLLSPLGMFHKSRLVWSGDYADAEPETDKNLYEISYDELHEGRKSHPQRYDMSMYRFIVNHTKKLYVDKNLGLTGSYDFHPLPLLTADGNGRGGGDYRGDDLELVGQWARDIISLELEAPLGYEELVCEFGEKDN
jgi:hypothetical protein